MSCIICSEQIDKNKNLSFCNTCSCDMCKDCVTHYILDYENNKCPQCRCNINTEEIINLYDIRVEISTESNQNIVVSSPSRCFLPNQCVVLSNEFRNITACLTLYVLIFIFTYNEIFSFFYCNGIHNCIFRIIISMFFSLFLLLLLVIVFNCCIKHTEFNHASN